MLFFNAQNLGLGVIISSVVGIFAGLLLGWRIKAGEIDIKVLTIAFLIACAFYIVKWWREREGILAENAIDYHRSLQLKRALRKFSELRSSDFPLVENRLPGSWKPYKMEHHLSSSTRSALSGEIELRGSFLFGFGRGTIEATTKGISVPNLLDSSTIILFKSGEQTLRAIIPSPAGSREMLVKIMESWYSGLPKTTHTYKALSSFSINDELLLTPVSNQQVIDKLEVSLEKPFEERPEVEVIGEELQAGVALTTALVFDGEQKMFLPSGLFRALKEEIEPLLGQPLLAPKLTESITR
ncbi:MAG: hypothetical protein AAB642_01295 [Patescibacteria group bacterium]